MVIIPRKSKLNFRFHNPNTSEATADYIFKIFLEVNQKKIDRVLQEEATNHTQMKPEDKSCYAG